MKFKLTTTIEITAIKTSSEPVLAHTGKIEKMLWEYLDPYAYGNMDPLYPLGFKIEGAGPVKLEIVP